MERQKKEDDGRSATLMKEKTVKYCFVILPENIFSDQQIKGQIHKGTCKNL